MFLTEFLLLCYLTSFVFLFGHKLKVEESSWMISILSSLIFWCEFLVIQARKGLQDFVSSSEYSGGR